MTGGNIFFKSHVHHCCETTILRHHNILHLHSIVIEINMPSSGLGGGGRERDRERAREREKCAETFQPEEGERRAGAKMKDAVRPG